jgi:MFS family permease
MDKFKLQKYLYDNFFNNKNYLPLWLIGFLINILRWSEIVITGIIIFKITNSPLQVTLLLIFRFLSLMSLSVISGIITDKYNKKYCLSTSLFLMSIISLIFYFLSKLDINIFILQLYSIVSGLFWAIESTVRKSLIIESIKKENYAKSISLDTFTLHLTRFIGPLISGFFYELYILSYLFVFATFIYSISFLLSTILKYNKNNNYSNNNINYNLAAIYKIILQNKKLLLVYFITIIFNIWAYAHISLLPAVVEIEEFYEAKHISYLFCAEALGSLISILYVIIYDNYKFYKSYYIIGTVITLICSLLFCFSTNIYFTYIILFISGIGSGLFSAMQPILVVLYSPPDYKGSMLGILNLCIGFATIGFFHVGILSSLYGVKDAIYVSSIEGLIIIVATLFIFQKIAFKLK